MHIFTTLLLIAPLPQEWSAHPLPALCQAPAHTQGLELLGSASHIAIEAGPATTNSPAEAFLAPSLLTQLIASEFSRSDLTLIPGSDPLLIRSGEAARTQLEQIFSALEDASAALQIQLSVHLTPLGPSGVPTAGGSTWTVALRSGDTLSLGTREERPFIGGYLAEVATDAGIADPQSSRALYGDSLHLTCCRVRGGEAVHIEGVLDLAELIEVKSFDPDTPDLGLVEQPRIELCQIAFSGVATPGQPLRVRLMSTDAQAIIGNRLLTVSASTERDPAAPSAGWAVRDLAFLSTKGLPLSAPRPGLRPHARRAALLPGAHSTTSPASLVGLLTERSSVGGDTGRIHSTERLLLIPAADKAALARADALVRTMEAPLLAQLNCAVEHGNTQIEFSVTHGRQARVVLGEERPWLTDYSLDIASNSWMPSTVTETAFDGICVEGRAATGALNARWWAATTAEVHIADSDTAHIGALQQPLRTFAAGSQRLERGSSSTLHAPTQPLKLSLK